MVLLATITLDDETKASLFLGDVTGNADTTVQAIAAGEDGNLITLEFVEGIAAALTEDGTTVSVTFIVGVTTVADIEALIATSTLIEVLTAGTGATILDAGDAFSHELTSGSDNTPVTGITPEPGDTLTITAPGQTTSVTGRVDSVGSITQAGVSVRVLGRVL